MIFAASTIVSVSTLAQDTPATPPAAAAPKAAAAPAAKAGQTGTAATPAAKKSAATTAKKPVPLTFTTNKQKASYAMGLNQGRSLHKNDVDIDTSAFSRGLKDGMAGSKPLLTDQEAQAAMNTVSKEVQTAQMEKIESCRCAKQETGRRVFGGKQDEGRSRRSAERIAIQDDYGRNWAQTHSRRLRGVQLPWNGDQRNGIR